MPKKQPTATRWIYTLKNDDLIRQLQDRNLDTEGTVDDLRRRLVENSRGTSQKDGRAFGGKIHPEKDFMSLKDQETRVTHGIIKSNMQEIIDIAIRTATAQIQRPANLELRPPQHTKDAPPELPPRPDQRGDDPPRIHKPRAGDQPRTPIDDEIMDTVSK